MVASVKIGTKGRIYIPPEVREVLDVKEGDYIVIREEKGRLYIEKLK